MNSSILLVLLIVLGDDPPELAAPPAPEGPCQLVVEGEGVEKLLLLQHGSNRYTVDVTKPSVFLPADRYRVEQVTLKGGYSYSISMAEFALTADEPYHLQLGEPTPHVDAKRQGRLLKLDYRLTDPAGRRCRNIGSASPSGFSVFQDGREIASGSFEYG